MYTGCSVKRCKVVLFFVQTSSSLNALVFFYFPLLKMYNVRHLQTTSCTYASESVAIIIIIIVGLIKRQFIRRSNMAIESLQGRHTMFAAHILESVN